jgi:hypothetical protein
MKSLRHKYVLAGLVLAVYFGCLQSPTCASIIIGSALTSAWVESGNSSGEDIQRNFSLSGAMTSATISGFSATHDTVYGQTGFSNTTGLTRQGDVWDTSRVQGYVIFTALNNDFYAISGSYSNSSGLGYFFAGLYDLTTSTSVSGGGGNINGGGTLNLGSGLTGSLVAGHSYEWDFLARTQAFYDPDSGATASGSASIQFFSAVPEPSSFLIFGTLGLVGLVGRRRSKVC